MDMPLPMVHLAVAVQLAEKTGQPPSPAFLLGSIAPDAIHMRPNIRLYDQGDKEVTYLNNSIDIPDHQRVLVMLTAILGKSSSLKQFAIGYAAHILLDRLWIKSILQAFYAHIPTEIDENERKRLYYRDTDQCDCN